MKRLATKLRRDSYDLQDRFEDMVDGNLGLLAALHMVTHLPIKTALDELYSGIWVQLELDAQGG